MSGINVSEVINKVKPRTVSDWLAILSKLVKGEWLVDRDEVRKLFVEVFGFEPDNVEVYPSGKVVANKSVDLPPSQCREILGKKLVEDRYCYVRFKLTNVESESQDRDWTLVEGEGTVTLYKIFTANGKKYLAEIRISMMTYLPSPL